MMPPGMAALRGRPRLTENVYLPHPALRHSSPNDKASQTVLPVLHT